MDTELSTFESLKRHRADRTIGTMAARTVVVNFNIFEHGLAHLFTSEKALAVNGLHLQAAEEAFSTGSSSVAEVSPLHFHRTVREPLDSYSEPPRFFGKQFWFESGRAA